MKVRENQILRPFFIVGSPRSGTTLLRFMLSSHSRLYVPDETGFIPFLKCDPHQQLTIEQTARVLQRIGRLNRFWNQLIPDIADFHDSLPEPRLPFLLDALYRQEGRLAQGVRWGDKTPLYVRYIPEILAIFPQAQFIHVVRDGRDATLSAYEKWGKTTWYMDHYYLLRNWQRNVQVGIKAESHLPADQFFSLHFETLIRDPEKILRQVSNFLGESFEPAMLDHTNLARKVGGGIDQHVEVQAPIHTRNIERWRREMTSFQKKMSDKLTGDTLRQLGYPLAEEGPFSRQEWLNLKLLAAKFVLNDGVRNLLYRTGILTLNKNRR